MHIYCATQDKLRIIAREVEKAKQHLRRKSCAGMLLRHMGAIQIRRAQAEDLATVVALRQAIAEQSPSLHGWAFEDLPSTFNLPRQNWTSYHGHVQLVAIEDGNLVAFLAVSLVTAEAWERLCNFTDSSTDIPAVTRGELQSDLDIARHTLSGKTYFLWVSHVLWLPLDDLSMPVAMSTLVDMACNFFKGNSIEGIGLFCAKEYSAYAEALQLKPIRVYDTFTVNTRVRADRIKGNSIVTNKLDELLVPYPWIQHRLPKINTKQVLSRVTHKIALREHFMWDKYLPQREGRDNLIVHDVLKEFDVPEDQISETPWSKYISDLRTKAPEWIERRYVQKGFDRATFRDLAALDNPSYLVPGDEWLRAVDLGVSVLQVPR